MLQPVPHPFLEPPHPDLALAPLTLHSREIVGQAIARAGHLAGVRTNRTCNDKTHLFRHLTAMSMLIAGQSEGDIQAALGHFQRRSTLYYLDALAPESLMV
jgi:site-specific recombinase XerD